MTEEVTEKNPFDGVPFGRGVRMLLADPNLAPHFDKTYKDETEFDTLERARLHQVNSFYRGTITGASALHAMHSIVSDGPPKIEPGEVTPAIEAQDAWAARLQRGVTHKEFKPYNPKTAWEETKEKYESVLDDLASFERMAPASTFGHYVAAIGGAIAGGIPTIENVVAVPIKGVTIGARMLSGGLQAAAVNVVTDPVVQAINEWTGTQKEYDPWQTALSAPLGFVIGGGLVGAGEVLSKTMLRSAKMELAIDDPAVSKVAQQQVEPIASRAPLREELPRQPDYQRPPEVVKSLQKMVSDLEEAVRVPIRQGRLDAANLGEYHTQTGVIHIKEFPDFSVAVHEVAHALDARIPEIKNLQTQFAGELAPLDYDPTKMRLSEGFAEFMRMWMTNPVAAQKRAPAFYSTFNNLLEQKAPELLEKFIQFQKTYDSYLKATPEQAIEAMIVSQKETWGERFVKKFTDAKVASTVRNVMSLAYDALINKNADISRWTRAVGEAIHEETGNLTRILPSKDPRALFEMRQRSAQTAMVHLLEGVVPYKGNDPSGPSLSQAVTTALGKPSLTGKWDVEAVKKFEAYMVMRRGLVLWDKYHNGDLPHVPLNESPQHLQDGVDKLEKEFPSFRVASEMVHDFSRAYAERAKDAGILGFTETSYKKMLEDPFYIPFNRDMSDKGKSATGSRPVSPVSLLRHQTGSVRDIISPLSKIIDNALAVEYQIAHNEVIRAMVDLGQRAGKRGGAFIEPLPPHETQKIEFDLQDAIRRKLIEEGWGHNSAKVTAQDFVDIHFGSGDTTGTMFRKVTRNGYEEPIVFYAEEGKLKAARVMTKEEGFGAYELLTTQPAPARDLAVQLMGLGSSMLTSGIVTHWAYGLRNVFRDQFAAAAFVPGYIPFWDAAKGLGHEFRQDKFAREYARLGGVSPGVQIAPLSEAVRADVDALAKKGYGIHKLTTIQGLSHAVSFMESATRLGVTEKLYNQGLKAGLSDYDALINATRQATDLLDFGRFGSHTQAVRTFTPFLNAWAQSLDKMRRTMFTPLKYIAEGNQHLITDKEELNRALYAWGTLGITGFGLGAMWAAINWEKDAYRDAGPSAKGANFVVPLGNGKVFLAPKPWELSIGFTAGEYLFAKIMKDDPRAGEQFMKASWDALQPPVPFWSNPWVKTTSEIVSNHNTFTGGSIVPERLKKLEEQYQADAETSNLAKRLGRTLGWSPKKIDYAINGYLGYWGRDLTTLSKGDDSPDPTQNLLDYTLLRAGIKDPTMLSDAREKFWKHMGQTTGDYSKAVNTYNYLMQSPRTAPQAKEYFNSLSDSRKAWVTLSTGGDEEGKKAFTADEKRAHPLTRAVNAVALLSRAKDQVANNVFTDLGSKTEININPDTRKKLVSVIGQMALAEMVNALIITKEPGYAGRPLFDMSTFYAQINGLDPRVSEEIKTRYGTSQIYKTEEVARQYEQLQDTLIRGGTSADLSVIAEKVKLGGFEFGGERRKRQQLRRESIQGASK